IARRASFTSANNTPAMVAPTPTIPPPPYMAADAIRRARDARVMLRSCSCCWSCCARSRQGLLGSEEGPHRLPGVDPHLRAVGERDEVVVELTEAVDGLGLQVEVVAEP